MAASPTEKIQPGTNEMLDIAASGGPDERLTHAKENSMNLAINGSYAPYAYVALLQLSLFYLQRLGLNRLVASPQGERISMSDWTETYCLLTRVIGSTLSWGSWILGLYVGVQFDVISGLLFSVVGICCSILLMLVVPSWPRADLIAHVFSIPATAYLFRAMLLSIGVETLS